MRMCIYLDWLHAYLIGSPQSPQTAILPGAVSFINWPLPFLGAGFEPAPVGTPGCAGAVGFISIMGGSTGAKLSAWPVGSIDGAGAGGAGGGGAGASSFFGGAKKIIEWECI